MLVFRSHAFTVRSEAIQKEEGVGGEGRRERRRNGRRGEGCDNFKPMQQLQLVHVQDMWMCFSSTRCFCTDECCYNSLLVCLQITTAISNVQLYMEHAGNTNQQGTHTCAHVLTSKWANTSDSVHTEWSDFGQTLAGTEEQVLVCIHRGHCSCVTTGCVHTRQQPTTPTAPGLLQVPVQQGGQSHYSFLP